MKYRIEYSFGQACPRIFRNLCSDAELNELLHDLYADKSKGATVEIRVFKLVEMSEDDLSRCVESA